MSSRTFPFFCLVLFVGAGTVTYSWFKVRQRDGYVSPAMHVAPREPAVEISSTFKSAPYRAFASIKTTEAPLAPLKIAAGDVRLNAQLDFEFGRLASRKGSFIDRNFGDDKAAKLVFLMWLQANKPEASSAYTDETIKIIERYHTAEDVEQKRNIIAELLALDQRIEEAARPLLEEWHRLNPFFAPRVVSPVAPPVPPVKTFQ